MSELEYVICRLEKIEAALENSLPPKEILTSAEAAKYLGVAQSYLYKLMHWGRIPYYKPHGRLTKFLRTDLDKFLLQNRVKTELELEAEADERIFGLKR